jgi:serine/threonine protein kinase
LVDHRADIWAFGVILYEMLTGERPFAGETVSDTLIEVATKEPPLEAIPALEAAGRILFEAPAHHTIERRRHAGRQRGRLFLENRVHQLHGRIAAERQLAAQHAAAAGGRPGSVPGVAKPVRWTVHPGLQRYWKDDFVDRLTDESIALHVKHGSHLPSMFSTMHMYPINGAVHRVASEDTAFSYRRTKWAEVIVGVDPDPANKDKIVNWARDYWDAVHPYSAPGAYVNFMMEEGTARVEATYGANYARLQDIKTKYDPGNLFRVNQNIAPIAAGQEVGA